MSEDIGTYSFLPWLRQGIANQIVGGATQGGRAVIDVKLTLTGTGANGPDKTEEVDRQVALYGPGDLGGFDQSAVFRTEPRSLITNFESNYFPSVEFYDEDFCWRYTPLTPDAHGRLRPWIALVVLEKRELNPEFENGQDVRKNSLPYIEVTDTALFPPADQLWAWAHVHVNRGLAADIHQVSPGDMAAVLAKLQATLHENRDLAYSRLLCPRKLAPNRGYHAFVVPTFESGRRAGLGLDPYAKPALPDIGTSAWEEYAGRPAPTRYPYFYRWEFRTGGKGDFESLVRLLQPRKANHDVGRRDLDGQNPGATVRGVEVGRPDLGGILKLGGALKVPEIDFSQPELDEVNKYENWATPYPQPTQVDLATLVNLADDYAAQAAAAANAGAGIDDPAGDADSDPDPVITPPLYGMWHAMAKRLLVDRAGADLPNRRNWLHELNLDPRFRAGAGFGTRVVQQQQESFMDAAWDQIGKVLEGNRRIRLGQLAVGASTAWYDGHLLPLGKANQQGLLLLTAPLAKRVLHGGTTVHQQLADSFLQPAMTSGALRRMLRPRARLMSALPFSAARKPADLLTRANAGLVSAAPPRLPPPGATKLDDLAKAVVPKDAPPLVVDWLRRAAWMQWLPLLLGLALIIVLVLLFPGVGLVLGLAVAAAAWALYRRLAGWVTAVRASEVVADPAPPASSIEAIPPHPDFHLTEPGSDFVPATGASDSVEATKLKAALVDISALIGAGAVVGRPPVRKRLDLAAVATSMVATVDPRQTIPKRVMASVALPGRIRAEIGERFVEAMAYPVIDTPMYEPLKDISSELFLPNISLIADNSVTLLETNEKFIESYMVGLNHEFARELLWREYPTDQRGSYFRQFWDVSGFFDTGNHDDATLREKLRDITPLDRWPATSGLDSHNNRGSKSYLVLVIRGELLKRYPNAVIYAQHAVWQRTHGKIDPTLERQLDEPTGPEETAKPPPDKIRTPLFEARIAPDIFFFGFDLDPKVARGGTGKPGDEEPGWFFVVKQRPGEPTFGLDLDQATTLNVWNDLSWPDVQPGDIGSFIEIKPSIGPLVQPTKAADAEKIEQYADDKNVAWHGADMTSAELAYVFFQAPVMVAMHASLMLGPGT